VSEGFWERAQRIFTEAAAADLEERRELLDRLCEGDDRLRAEVESLLGSDERAAGFMEGSVAGALSPGETVQGKGFGAYALDEELGEGGMGVVYRAHRADGAYEQEVVVKLIRDHAVSGELEQRFRRERQVLASLRHEHIARLLDGGVAGGTPYLVMELVRGRNILEHCDEAGLDLDRRLALFDAVCAGVQHAHANLVVHRDLKPAHVLIDESDTPKLLDFGIAAMLDQAGGTVDATSTGQQRLTPQYASPEQIRGEPVTTATDVYALGLILYELLCGHRPYEVEEGSSDADRRLICDTTPPSPSRRLENEGNVDRVASARGMSVPRLRKHLTGDLDTIVMTALRKEAERRYASAEALREDLRRYREGLPIGACPDTWGYRARKFVSRHRVPVTAGAAVLFALVAAVIVTSRQAAIARERARETELALATSHTVGRFLRSILVAADPREGGQNVTMRDALDQSAARIEPELGNEPQVEARVREAIGMTYRSLGEHNEADLHLTRAHEIAERVFAGDPEAARIGHELAVLRLDQGRLGEARALATEALRVRESHGGPRHEDALETRNLLALVSLRQDRPEEALEHARVAVAGRKRTLGRDDARTLEAKNTLGEILKAVGRQEEAAELMREVYHAQTRALGKDHPDTLISANDLGATLFRMGRREEGLAWQIRAMEGLAKQFPAGSLDVVIPRINIAGSLIRVGRHEEARRLASRAIEDGAPALGKGHYVVAVARLTLGRALIELGETEEARGQLERAHETLAEELGPDHRFTRDAAEALERLDAPD